jgi:dTDP-4-amino-4,6-dideoxygalactose transaminase
MQAGFLQVKLAHLAKWNSQRREHAAKYSQLLADNESITCPYEPSWSRAVYHLYVIRTDDRDGMIRQLQDAGIGTGIHYPVPLHLQKAYDALGYASADFPNAVQAASEIVSLPMFPQLTADQQFRVVEQVGRFTSAALQKRGVAAEVAGVSAEQTA